MDPFKGEDRLLPTFERDLVRNPRRTIGINPLVYSSSNDTAPTKPGDGRHYPSQWESNNRFQRPSGTITIPRETWDRVMANKNKGGLKRSKKSIAHKSKKNKSKKGGKKTKKNNSKKAKKTNKSKKSKK